MILTHTGPQRRGRHVDTRALFTIYRRLSPTWLQDEAIFISSPFHTSIASGQGLAGSHSCRSRNGLSSRWQSSKVLSLVQKIWSLRWDPFVRLDGLKPNFKIYNRTHRKQHSTHSFASHHPILQLCIAFHSNTRTRPAHSRVSAPRDSSCFERVISSEAPLSLRACFLRLQFWTRDGLS